MKYYSIIDLVHFLKYQKMFNYKAVEAILTIFNSLDKTEEEKLSEIHYILMECGMDGFINVWHDM